MPVQTATPLAPQPGDSQNGRAIVLMTLGMFTFAAVDIQAKLLVQTLPPLQIVWIRQLGLLIGVLALLALRGRVILHSRTPGLQIARGGLAVISATFFILGIRHVPIANAAAVSFVAPFIVTIFGALLLGEPVGIRRWLAVTVGFLGTLVVIRPGSGTFQPAMVFVLIAAFAFALRQVLSRPLTQRDGLTTTVAYTALTGSAILTLPLPFVWQSPGTGTEFALLFGIAALTVLGEICVIRALQLGEAVAVAPVQYTLILWATGYGYMVFGDLPDAWTWTGTAIIVTSGLYTFWRERRAAGRDG